MQKTTRNNLFSPPKSKENTVQKFLYFLPFLCLEVEEYLIKLLIEKIKKRNKFEYLVRVLLGLRSSAVASHLRDRKLGADIHDLFYHILLADAQELG